MENGIQILKTKACIVLPRDESRLSLVYALLAFLAATSVLSLEASAATSPLTGIAPTAKAVTQRAIRTATADQIKPDLISRFKGLQLIQAQELTGLDEQIRKGLKETSTVGLNQQNLKASDVKLKSIANGIEDLIARRPELAARREVWERLTFALESKWTNQPLGPFLEHECMQIAETDISEPAGGSLWKFLTFLSVAIREIPDPREDVLSVIESYMRYSGVLEPRTPAQFMADRQYTNGNLSFTARPVPRESLGDIEIGRPTGTTRARARIKTTSPKAQVD